MKNKKLQRIYEFLILVLALTLLIAGNKLESKFLPISQALFTTNNSAALFSVAAIKDGVENLPKPWNSTETMTNVASIATAIATLIALIGLYQTWQAQRKQLKQQEAAQIRQELRAIAKDSKELYFVLEDEYCLIAASSAIAKELCSRLKASVTHEELLQHYLSNEALMRSVATQGWHSSSLTPLVESKTNQLKQAGIILDGQLRIVSETIELYTKLIQAKCSPQVFTEILLMEPQHGCLCNSSNEQDIKELINILTVDLQKTSIEFCLNTYIDDLERIQKFINSLSNEFIKMNDEQLIEHSKKQFENEQEEGFPKNKEHSPRRSPRAAAVKKSLEINIENLKNQLDVLRHSFTTYCCLDKQLQQIENRLDSKSEEKLEDEIKDCFPKNI